MIITVEEASKALLEGEVVALPTETVYGLAAKFDNEKAVREIFSLKKRPQDNPLIVHIANLEELKRFVFPLDQETLSLAKAFWPGPLTIILKVDTTLVPSLVRAGLKTVAFRVPNHEQTLEVIRQVGPLVMPSANLSGRPSSTAPSHVEQDFGSHVPVVDGGCCSKGVESTVIVKDKDNWKIARQGFLSKEQIEEVLQKPVESFERDGKVISPGTKYKHYAPKATLRSLSELSDTRGKVILGFRERVYKNTKKTYFFSSVNDPEGICQSLYNILRQLDHEHVKEAYVDMDFPKNGLYQTIYERLLKASHNEKNQNVKHLVKGVESNV